MTIHVPGEFSQFVDDLVSAGSYPSADAVVCDALRLLREVQEKQAELKAEIARGMEEGDRGNRRPLQLDEVLRNARKLQAERTPRTS